MLVFCTVKTVPTNAIVGTDSICAANRVTPKSVPLYYPGDEGIVAGASNPPGLRGALADLERGFTDRATPKSIPSSQLPR